MYELSALSFSHSEIRWSGLLFLNNFNIKNTTGIVITLYVNIILKSFVSKVQSAYWYFNKLLCLKNRKNVSNRVARMYIDSGVLVITYF